MQKLLPLITGAGLAMTIAGCGAATPHYDLKPAAAMAIVSHYNLENAIANKTLNQTLDRENETGLSAQIDNASYQMLKLQGKPGIGNGKPADWHITNYVFNQASYPAYFLSVATPSESKSSNFFLFIKTSKVAPWKVDFEPNGPTKLLPSLISAGNGYYAAGPIPKNTIPYSNAFASVANYWTSYAHPDQVLANMFTGTLGASGFITELQQNAAKWQKAASGDTYDFTATPDPTPIVLFPAKGGVLAFGGIDSSEEFSVTTGEYVTQDASRQYFSPLLSPGKYTDVTISFITEALIYIPDKGKDVVVGDDVGPIGALGTPYSSPG